MRLDGEARLRKLLPTFLVDLERFVWPAESPGGAILDQNRECGAKNFWRAFLLAWRGRDWHNRAIQPEARRCLTSTISSAEENRTACVHQQAVLSR